MTAQPPPGPPAPTPPYGSPGAGAAPASRRQSGPPPWSYDPRAERRWSTVAHLGGLLGPLPALVIHLWQRNRGPFVAAQTTEALNFQITMLIAYAGSTIAGHIIDVVLRQVIILHPVVWLFSAVLSVLAALAARRGVNHRYPWTLRIVP